MKRSYARARRREQNGIQYKHDLGQHFLYDEALLRSLIAQAGIGKEDAVLEIGAGSGALTVCLSEAAKRVIAVEVDAAVLPFLRAATQRFANVEIVQGDIRSLDLPTLCAPLGAGFHVAGNIPYNITTPILSLFVESALPVRQMSLMVQKEVAARLLSEPGTPDWSLMSARCRYRCEPRLIADVPRERFTPPPHVDSAFIALPFRDAPPAPVRDERLLFRLMRAGFALRRKTLCNALRGALPPGAPEPRALLESVGLPPTVRGEALRVEDWIALANAVSL